MSLPPIVIRLELKQVEPCIWRVVRVPGDLALADLHRVLQTVMGWVDRHPHSFEIVRQASAPAVAAGPRDIDILDERMTLADALAAGRHGFTYTYGGSDWRIRIKRAAGVWRSRTNAPILCFDGYLAGPADDAGGPAAYTAVLAATLERGARLTAADRKRLGPNFDPEGFDRAAINRALARILAA